MRFSNDFGDRYDECSRNGYEAKVEKSFYPIGENKPNLLELKDMKNRMATVIDISKNDENNMGIQLFNNDITLEQAEILIKELQDGIKFAKYLKENL